jgi:AAA+ superfamily predicted ATPase
MTPGSNIPSVFRDSQLMDAVLVLDDFQIFWGQAIAGVGAVSASSNVAIGLLLHELSQFPGICILVANNVQGSIVHRIDPELTRRLKFLVEFKLPDAPVRTQMWKKMIPTKCPLSPNINYEELGRRFDFTSGSISSAIVRGAAKESLRTGEDNVLTYEDLIDAAEAEKAHFRDDISELLLSAYI